MSVRPPFISIFYALRVYPKLSLSDEKNNLFLRAHLVPMIYSQKKTVVALNQSTKKFKVVGLGEQGEQCEIWQRGAFFSKILPEEYPPPLILI